MKIDIDWEKNLQLKWGKKENFPSIQTVLGIIYIYIFGKTEMN